MKSNTSMLKHLKFIITLIGFSLVYSQWIEAQNKNEGPIIRVAKYQGDRECAISYTYDDGMREHYTLVAPEMEKRGFRGTFWVNGISVNEEEDNEKDTTRVSWANLKEMAERGHEISNHGWSHKNLTKITLEEVRTEIKKKR